MPALGDALGIGQLTVVAVPLAIGAILIVAERPASRLADALSAVMFSAALAKPSLTIPLFWVLACKPRRLRPAFLTVVVYGTLTLVACQWQQRPVLNQLRGWIVASEGNAGQGYGHIQNWLAQAGARGAFLPVAAGLLVLTGAWVWWRRRQDTWILTGICAVVARIWTYHRVYDDAILLIALVAVVRALSGAARPPTMLGPGRRALWAAAGVAVAVLWMPIQLRYLPATAPLFSAAHTTVTVGMLFLLMSA
jgi:hypothetical protein